jgi:cytosine deaminase
LVRRCVLPDTSTADVAIVDGRIDLVSHAPIEHWQGADIDAHGKLLTPGLTDPHLHPDKAFGLEDGTDGATSLLEAIARVRARKPEQTAELIRARTLRLLEWCLALGTTRVRLHAEVDPLLGLRGVEGVLQARAALAGRMHVQLVAFPQEGIVREPGTLELLREALRTGCDVVGAISYQDPDPRQHLELAAELARDFDVQLDVHADSGVPLERSALDLIAEIARQYQRNVLVGHATTLALMDAGLLERTAAQLASAHVAVCALPRTDLFMDRRVAPLEALRQAGVRTCIGTNNVVNAFTPVGRPSLPSVASVYALTAGVSRAAELDDLATSLWSAAACVGVTEPRIARGADADVCLWPCAAPWQLVASEAEPELVVVGGAIVSRRRDAAAPFQRHA